MPAEAIGQRTNPSRAALQSSVRTGCQWKVISLSSKARWSAWIKPAVRRDLMQDFLYQGVSIAPDPVDSEDRLVPLPAF